MISLLLHNIRSVHNVGSLIRSADGFGIDEIVFSGYTPYPRLNGDSRLPHVIDRQTRLIHKTALGAETNVRLSRIPDPNEVIDSYRKLGYTIAGLEQDINSVTLRTYKPPKKLLLLLGEEVNGIAKDLRMKCDILLEIEMHGHKESFNVSVAGSIAMYALTERA